MVSGNTLLLWRCWKTPWCLHIWSHRVPAHSTPAHIKVTTIQQPPYLSPPHIPSHRQDTLLLASYAPTSSQHTPGLHQGCSSPGASLGTALDTRHLPLMSPEVTAPPTPVTFQGHRLEEAKLLQHLDEEDQDHQHRNHLKAFQVHGGGVSWPLTPSPLPTTILEPPHPSTSAARPCIPRDTRLSLVGFGCHPLLRGTFHQPWVSQGSAQGCAGGSGNHG